MVKVLAMMKVPTNSAIPAKTSSPCFIPLIEAAIISAWSSASCLPVSVSTRSLGRALSRADFRALCEVPAAARTSISS